MARKLRKIKPLIYVFCEGESEQAYTDFLKTQNFEIVQMKQMKSGFSLTLKPRILENGNNV